MRPLNLVMTITVMLALNITNTDTTECDRECLIKMADDYLSALVTHNPEPVPLADDVRIVENANPIEPGEGLWKPRLRDLRNSGL